jgi:hypothetical protein
LTGVVVAVDEFPGRIVLTVDDSSGVNIEATCAAPPKPEDLSIDPVERANAIAKRVAALSDGEKRISPDGPNLTNIDVGCVVKIKGGVSIFRGQKQINLKSITILGDTNAEVKCWNEAVAFKSNILSQPWVVTPGEETDCRRQADREKELEKEEERRRKEGEERRKRKELRKHLKAKRVELDAKKHQAKTQEGGGEKHQEYKSSGGGTGHGNKRKPEKMDSEGLDPTNKANYPSKAARRRAAGKYDTLGF